MVVSSGSRMLHGDQPGSGDLVKREDWDLYTEVVHYFLLDNVCEKTTLRYFLFTFYIG